MHTDYWFPTPIYIKDLKNVENLNTYLENHILNWAKTDKGIQKTNVSGWHSPCEMQNYKEYQLLINILYEFQKEIYEKEKLSGNPILGNMWANINPKGSYNLSHTHPNCAFSGVYYVKASKNSGNICFEDPRPGVQIQMLNRKKEKIDPQNWKRIEYNPSNGRIIMFPSWLSHSVEQNLSDDIRISVSFNFLQDELHNIFKSEDIKNILNKS